ncbi:YibE/F family protein [Cellulosilyticum sp. I15G10I2]|uniref:YibE/F family protein n=1 Tax=Cellulosilyticum sp. I15G10I2 TaxID=1892843 RepID=UPI00085BC3EB|nr:YibE/F family protein [Cellulosilyticum sp. I15G10I2]
MNKQLKYSNLIFLTVVIIIIGILTVIPTGFETDMYKESVRVKAKIIEVNNTSIIQTGIIKQGNQSLKVQVLSGKYKGDIYEAVNHLRGQMEFDKIFEVGDMALVVLDLGEDKEVIFANAIDHYRLELELVLFIVFVVGMIGVTGWTGVRAILSFVFTILMIWKILIPSFLKGFNPILIAMGSIIIIAFVIIFLVAGFTKKGAIAFLGSFFGVLLTGIFALGFGKAFKLHGAVVPFSETLLYSGYHYLNLTSIFLAGIFIASSGAVMDVAMDIAASLDEIVEKKPELTTKEVIASGLTVSRSVLGTIVTTLLLAYSGGYTALMMVFMAQGTPLVNILNITYVSSEILHTLVGSFGLVLVAPVTSVIGGVILTQTKS